MWEMTNDELRRLIAECDGKGWINYAAIARDALRFRWLASKATHKTATFQAMGFETPMRVIHWQAFASLTQDLRAAIDADMEANP